MTDGASMKIALPAALLAAALSFPAFAQSGIGSATTIERDVSGTVSGRTRALATGDGVFSNENIRTANASAAQLRFIDNTQISIGPSASVTLDRFVFNADGNARAAAARITQGAMRWVSGASSPRAYTVRTPHAVIGVRGTAFDVLVTSGRTDVTLIEGRISVCPVSAPRNCAILVLAGQTVTVTSRGIQGVRPNGPRPTDFADRCLRAIDRAACTITARAEPPAVIAGLPVWTGFYVGVHGGYGNQNGTVGIDGTPSIRTSIGAGNVPASLGASGGSAVGGVQTGYSWQVQNIVFGVETDIAYTRLGGGSQVAVSPFGVLVTTTTSNELRYLGTVRGRVGVAIGNVLVFGTGGFAYGGVEQSGSIVPVPAANPTYRGSRSRVAGGWAVGGGVEFAFAPNASIRLDYLHYDLGARTLTLGETTGLSPGDSATMRVKTKGDLGRVGVNYRF